MLLVVSRQEDSHTVVVSDRLRALDIPFELLDLSAFPSGATLSLRRASGHDPRHEVEFIDGRCIPLDAVEVVWWRRPQGFSLHGELRDPGYAAFAHTEVDEAFAGLWPSLEVFWINHPQRDREAGRKAWQLRLAADLGFEIPDTLITNDPARARAFVAARGAERTIYKSFSATARHWRETRVLRGEELAMLDAVRFAPVIFQEYVPADVDLRITMIGDQVFPAAIYSQDTSYVYDFRMDMFNARIEACALPGAVEDRLRVLMRRLGLSYGAIDMRRTPDGRHVFLEINPAGQWLFVEERTGQPITDALCALIAARMPSLAARGVRAA